MRAHVIKLFQSQDSKPVIDDDLIFYLDKMSLKRSGREAWAQRTPEGCLKQRTCVIILSPLVEDGKQKDCQECRPHIYGELYTLEQDYNEREDIKHNSNKVVIDCCRAAYIDEPP